MTPLTAYILLSCLVVSEQSEPYNAKCLSDIGNKGVIKNCIRENPNMMTMEFTSRLNIGSKLYSIVQMPSVPSTSPPFLLHLLPPIPSGLPSSFPETLFLSHRCNHAHICFPPNITFSLNPYCIIPYFPCFCSVSRPSHIPVYSSFKAWNSLLALSFLFELSFLPVVQSKVPPLARLVSSSLSLAPHFCPLSPARG